MNENLCQDWYTTGLTSFRLIQVSRKSNVFEVVHWNDTEGRVFEHFKTMLWCKLEHDNDAEHNNAISLWRWERQLIVWTRLHFKKSVVIQGSRDESGCSLVTYLDILDLATMGGISPFPESIFAYNRDGAWATSLGRVLIDPVIKDHRTSIISHIGNNVTFTSHITHYSSSPSASRSSRTLPFLACFLSLDFSYLSRFGCFQSRPR